MMLRLVLILVFSIASTATKAAEAVSGAGRLEYDDTGGTCSAALVRPDLVVTAAHCAQGPERPTNIFFRTGQDSDGERYPVDLLVPHPLYDRDSPRLEWRLRFDIAVARLARPVPETVARPFSGGDVAQPGETLFIVSWREGQRPRQRACVVFEGTPGLVTLGCPVLGGESGAPVLRRTGSSLELVAVISSRARVLDQPVAQASDVFLRLPPLLDLIGRFDP